MAQGLGEASEGSPNASALFPLQSKDVVDSSAKNSLFRFPAQKAPLMELIPHPDIGLVPARIKSFSKYPLGATVSITGLIGPHEPQPREAAWAGSPETRMSNLYLPMPVSSIRQGPSPPSASVFLSAK